MLDYITKNPRQLFLIDGLGAMLTAFLTGIVLVYFESFFGMPKSILVPLALVACGFAIYSLTCYFLKPKNWQFYLKNIAIANLLYCCVTAACLVFYYSQLSIFGWLYFIGEILIVVSLAMFELRMTKKV